MNTKLPAQSGKGAYLPPATETMVVLFTSQAICGSLADDKRSSTTEVWEEEDLSTL